MSSNKHPAGASAPALSLVRDSEPTTIPRHSAIVRTVHWTVALSTAALVFTGLLQMPIAKRYFLDELPGMAWSTDYSVSLVLHYLAAAALVFGAVLHLVYHGLRREGAILPRRGDVGESVQIIKAMLGRGEEPPSHKYLAEQRLAYAFIAGTLALVIVSGLVKVLKNLPGVAIPETLTALATNLHNLGTGLVVFGIVAHLAAFLVPANRALLPSMFTGRVGREYARHRHSLWFEELERPSGGRAVVPVADEEGLAASATTPGAAVGREEAEPSPEVADREPPPEVGDRKAS